MPEQLTKCDFCDDNAVAISSIFNDAFPTAYCKIHYRELKSDGKNMDWIMLNSEEF